MHKFCHSWQSSVYHKPSGNKKGTYRLSCNSSHMSIILYNGEDKKKDIYFCGKTKVSLYTTE